MASPTFFTAALLSLLAAVPVAQASEARYLNASTGAALTPGVYGRVEFSHAPKPPLVSATPVTVTPASVPLPPYYVYAPPAHVKEWARHCGRYQACKRPVYFVAVDGAPERWWEEAAITAAKRDNGKPPAR